MPGDVRFLFGAAVLTAALAACNSAAPSADEAGGSGGTSSGGSGATHSGGTASGGTASGGQTGTGGTGGYAGGVYPQNCLDLCQAKADGDCLSVALEGCQGSCGRPTLFGDPNQCPVMMEGYYDCLLQFDACTTPAECSDEYATILNQCLGRP